MANVAVAMYRLGRYNNCLYNIVVHNVQLASLQPIRRLLLYYAATVCHVIYN